VQIIKLSGVISGGNVLFIQGGKVVYTVSLASLSSTNDYSLIEAFQVNGHTVLAFYGLNAPGTLASGVYLDSFVYAHPSSFTVGAYIIHWQGTTSNSSLPSDAYTFVYST
jgi:hypothetical protein